MSDGRADLRAQPSAFHAGAALVPLSRSLSRKVQRRTYNIQGDEPDFSCYVHSLGYLKAYKSVSIAVLTTKL